MPPNIQQATVSESSWMRLPAFAIFLEFGKDYITQCYYMFTIINVITPFHNNLCGFETFIYIIVRFCYSCCNRTSLLQTKLLFVIQQLIKDKYRYIDIFRVYFRRNCFCPKMTIKKLHVTNKSFLIRYY